MKEVKRELEERVKRLERELKDELPLALKKAREMGDLRENAEYQAAKERQTYVQAELSQLKERLSRLSLINLSKIPVDRVSYGSTVTLHDLDSGDEILYKLVTSEESDASRGLISTTSPIGRSLMGRQEGDEVIIQTPGGTKNFKLIRFLTLHDIDE